MSYKCEACKQQIKPKVPQTKVVTKVRMRPKNRGQEIAKEISVCPPCAENLSEKT